MERGSGLDRKPTKRGDETEKKILDAALYLFVRKGYHGASINEITKRVGLTKGALYSHFSGKSDLFLRIIDQFNTGFLDGAIQTIDQSPGNALDKINKLISFNSRFALENQDLCVFLTFLTTELHADVDFEPLLKDIYRRYQKAVAGLINLGIKQGLFTRTLEPEIAALTFIALHDGVLHQWTLNRSYLDGEQYVRTFRQIFLKGLVVRPSAINQNPEI